MYSTNNHISARQLNRLIVVDFLGLIGLLLPQTASYLSFQDGFIAIIYAILLSLLYTYIILLIKQKIKISLIDYIREKAGRFCSVIVGLFFAAKYFIVAVVVLYILGDIVNTVLLPEVNPILIIGSMLIVASFCVSKGIESRGRMAEILYYIILVPIIIILIFSFKDFDKYNITPLFIHSQANIIKTAFIIVVLFSPSEILLFGDENYVINKKTKKAVIFGILTVGIINLLIFVVNVGIFGVNGMMEEKWPTITLMQVVEITGKFFERQDGIMSIFYIVSLFSITSALIYYIVLILKKTFYTESKRRYGWIAVLLIFIVVSILMNGNYIWNMKSKETTRVEIENRQYVMALGIDKQNNELSITYAFPDISAQTGQEVKEDNSELFNCNIGNIYEAENIYSRQSDKKLDFSHLKVVILGVELLEDKELLNEVISYLKDEPEFARNTNLCISLETANSIISLDKNISGSIGNYIQKMFSNNLIGYSTTIEELISNQADNKLINIIPILNVQQEYPSLTESVILKGLDVVKFCDLNESSYFCIIDGEGEGSIINLPVYGAYQIESNDANTRINILSGRTIHLKLTLTGRLKVRDSLVENPDIDEINTAIEEIIEDQINSLRKEYNVDYMETHKLLSIYNKDLWKKYLDKEQELFDNLYIEVECDYTIKK